MVEGFFGAVVALVLVLMPNVAKVKWTNPNTPALYRIDWYAQRIDQPACSTRVAQYWGAGDPANDMLTPKIRPGKPDSLAICFPQHSDSVRFYLWWYGCDSLGNRITPRSSIVSWLNRGRF